jgi:hypothetical protein
MIRPSHPEIFIFFQAKPGYFQSRQKQDTPLWKLHSSMNNCPSRFRKEEAKVKIQPSMKDHNQGHHIRELGDNRAIRAPAFPTLWKYRLLVLNSGSCNSYWSLSFLLSISSPKSPPPPNFKTSLYVWTIFTRV